MNPLMDALERAGDTPPATQAQTQVRRLDAAPRLEIPADVLPGPIRAMREDAGSGPVVSAEPGFDDPRDPEERGEWHLDPIRATRDETGAGPVPEAGHDFDDPRDPEERGEWPLEPIRAARDDTGADPVSEAEHGFGDPHGPEERGEWHLEPIRAARDETGAGPVSEAEHDFADPRNPEALGERRLAAIRATRDGTGADAVAPEADEFDGSTSRAVPPESDRHSFDPGTLPPRRGAMRAAVALLSLFAVAAGGAAGGYLFWKAQLVRPALVRHLPSMPVAVVDLTPMPDANAATGVDAEAVAGTPISLAVPPAVSPAADSGMPTAMPTAGEAERPGPGFPDTRGPILTAAGTDAVPERSAGSAPHSAGKDETRTAATGVPPPDGEAGPRKTPPAGLLVMDSSRTSAVSGAASPKAPQDSPSSRVAGVPAHPTSARPESPAGDSMPSSATDVPAGTIEPPDNATGQAGTDPRRGVRARIAITKQARPQHITASLERAYAAYRTGDAASASQAYRAVLADEPRNRDALLGLAATAARAGRHDEAAAHYARVLALHPADAVARAGLIALHERDPVRSESALKALLRREPRAAHLHFDLGNVYAAQSRWAEAQRAYFDACRFDAENADYAYNLAVSLDHLAQRRGALDFYRKALALSQGRPVAFDTLAVAARVRDIDPSSTAGVTPAASSMTAGAARTGSTP